MANNFLSDSDVVALYRFESGALTTDSKGSHTLTAVNSPAANTSTYKQGAASCEFVIADSDHFTLADSSLSSSFPFKNGTTNNIITVCAWIRLSSLSSGYIHCIMSKWDSYNGRRTFHFSVEGDTGKLRVNLGYSYGNSSTTLYHGSTLSTSTWYHVTFSYRDSDKTYAFRVRDTSGNVVGTDIETTWDNNINIEDAPVYIGGFCYNNAIYSTSKFGGLIDELVVFKRFLTADEVTEIASGTYLNNDFSGDPNLVALYRFENGALGTDSSGNGNTLTEVNTPASQTSIYKEGSGSVDLERDSSEYFYRNDSGLSSNFPFKNGSTNNKITICAWVRYETVASSHIFSKYASNKLSFMFGASPTNKLQMGVGYNGGADAEYKNHGTALSTGTWYHVSGTFDGSNNSYTLRVKDSDGETIGSDISDTFSLEGGSVNIEDARIEIGSISMYSYYFDGLIDELVIFDKILTDEEITNIALGQYSSYTVYKDSVSDLMKASDSLSFTKQIPFSLSDIFKLSDSNSKVLKFYENISDLIKVSDSSVNSIKFINLVEDVFKLSEDLREHLALSFSPSDIAKFSDSSIKSLIIPFLAEDKFLVTDIAIATESGVYYFSVSDIIKASDSISVRKITSLEVLDVFELSDTGDVKKLSQVDVNDFLNLIDTDSIIKKTLLEVNDRLKAKDSATGIMVDDLSKAAIKLTFRGRTFLVLKERKTFTFKPRISFFTTKKG